MREMHQMIPSIILYDPKVKSNVTAREIMLKCSMRIITIPVLNFLGSLLIFCSLASGSSSPIVLYSKKLLRMFVIMMNRNKKPDNRIPIINRNPLIIFYIVNDANLFKI